MNLTEESGINLKKLDFMAEIREGGAGWEYRETYMHKDMYMHLKKLI